MSRPACVCINIQALRHNLSLIKKISPGSLVLAMLKANAYGHGLLLVAKALTDCDAFGVASIEEGIMLRQEGVKNRILLMGGFFKPEELTEIVEFDFEMVIHRHDQLAALLENNVKKAITVWLKIDTGMHRLGFKPSEAKNVLDALQTSPAVNDVILMTHLSKAENVQTDFTAHQITEFSKIADDFPGQLCIANSAGTLAWSDTHVDWIRPGLILYGISLFPDKCATDLGFKSVMSLRSELIAIHQLQTGDAVGYGGEWVCPEPMTVGIVAAGYGDGYPYAASNRAVVLVNGKKSKVIGRIAMDMLAVDLRGFDEVNIGDSVLLWGAELPVEKLANAIDTIPWALVCGIAPRVKLEVL